MAIRATDLTILMALMGFLPGFAQASERPDLFPVATESRVVGNDAQTRYSFVYEYTPFQFLQLRGGIRYGDGIPQIATERSSRLCRLSAASNTSSASCGASSNAASRSNRFSPSAQRRATANTIREGLST